MNRTCLIVSPYFPPSSLAGVHRARHLAKHLPATGWTPIVVCVDEAYHEERLDSDLAMLVPASVEVIKVSALSPRFCRPLGFGEISLRAWWPLRHAVMRLLATRPIDVVLITGSPYYPMLLTAEIKRRFGVPVVLDFQDPWMSAWGATQPRWSKGGVVHRLSRWLEPKAVRAADFITSVSEAQNAQLAARYPWLEALRMAAHPIGGDPDDYQASRMKPITSNGFALDPARFNLSYVGTVWPAAIDTLRTVLRAIAMVRATQPLIYRRLSLNFIGTTRNPETVDGSWVRPLAELAGVAEVVRELPERLPFLDALAVQARSDAILMLGSNEPHYTASKIYGVLMSGRPYLSVFHECSSSHDVLSRAGGGIAMGFDGPEKLQTLVVPLANAIQLLATNPTSLGPADPAAYEAFGAQQIAARFGDIFDRVSRASYDGARLHAGLR